MTTIVQSPDPVLRQVAAPVAKTAITTPAFQKIITSMKHALAEQEDGVAIAAPQIGESIRVFVVAARASKQLTSDTVFINPEFVRIGKEKKELSEGCLSVRWKYGTVKRATTATVRALNIDGNEFVMSARGLLAQIFQHEIDHLDGTLFIDKAKHLEDMPPTVSSK